MSWEPPGRAAAAPPPVERRLAVLVKAARSAQLVERQHPLGRELRCLVGSEFLWGRVFRPGEDERFESELRAAVEAFTARGWEPAE